LGLMKKALAVCAAQGCSLVLYAYYFIRIDIRPPFSRTL